MYPKRIEDQTPELQAAVARAKAAFATPEAREEEERARELVREEFPPAAADDVLSEFMAAVRFERERKGMNQGDVAAAMKVDRAVISRMEGGKVANPGYLTLRALARAVGKRLVVRLEDAEPGQAD